MKTLKEYTENNDFGGDGSSFPTGDTYLDLDKCVVEEKQVEFEGKKKMRWNIINDEKTFYAGIKVMKGIKSCVEEGFNLVRVTKTGSGLETNYSVIGVKSIPKD